MARLEGLERAKQGRTATRIVGAQFAGIKAGVGDIAATAAGNSNFGQKLPGFLEQGDARPRCGFSAGDGGKETSRTPANDDDSLAQGWKLKTNGTRLKR